jgi:hypothetical protein
VIALPHLIEDQKVRENFDALARAFNELSQFVDVGDGAPAHTPTTVKLYIDRTGGVGTSFYIFDLTGWVAVA